MAEVGNFRGLQAANKRKTFALLALFGALMWVVVYAALTYFGGSTAFIVPIAVGLSLVSVWGSYYGSDRLVLTMTGAKLITENDNPKLFNLVHEVVIASGLPMPKVAVVIDDAPNAFATGRNPEHALIAFTTGILDVMDRDELQGVIAHEMAHSYGVTDEGEANFIAWVICTRSEEPILRYAAHLLLLRYQLRDYHGMDPDGALCWMENLPKGIIQDLISIRESAEAYPPLWLEMSRKSNDLFLKSQGVKAGIKSYQQLPMLASAWRHRIDREN